MGGGGKSGFGRRGVDELLDMAEGAMAVGFSDGFAKAGSGNGGGWRCNWMTFDAFSSSSNGGGPRR